MEIKKSKGAELERYKRTWFAVGLMIVLSFMFIAFEWTEYDKKIELTSLAKDPIFEDTMSPVTYPEQPAPPPPPAPPVIEEFVIAEDREDISDIDFTTIDNPGTIEITYLPPVIDEDEVEVIEDKIFEIVEKMPVFPGGNAALFSFLNKNLQYPAVSRDNGTQGRVIVQFVVDKDGSINDLKVVRSVDPYLDKEALRVIKSMPKWSPGMQRNQPVKVKYTLPVIFRLQQ